MIGKIIRFTIALLILAVGLLMGYIAIHNIYMISPQRAAMCVVLSGVMICCAAYVAFSEDL